ncbi:MAG: CRISPR-associated helicase Cas3' [Gammaproteobacteria bacterium]|nr:CRISPR-associated helicase Cas3' [Gammaproteobacteria bacterium]MBU1556432.1 CRISPR-associated helicase Cas3' [Gammaproteobacteria bacterium]MBU2071984.1 CRISPR-associated helicase Cas3' [Gammaproteobacteria bacterium]MBU2183931.1 CRISPR-associated helicase Cas3' [Gammaproteobacteria bacterium]MBU2203315.1 CRISPR-associated helicase Cas3' [Gammaproteobacteria bacterium]
MDYIAHPAKTGAEHQSVKTHLTEVGQLAATYAGKIGHDEAGILIGLLHDFGKYSKAFQDYMLLIIRELGADYDPDLDEVESKSLKGKIDHSSAGAQWLFNKLVPIARKLYADNGSLEQKLAIAVVQILALCVASHHSGLIDNLPSENGAGFQARLKKADEQTHLQECIQSADAEVISKAESIATAAFINDMVNKLKSIISKELTNGSDIVAAFNLGFYTKFLFSCLIDADRVNSADFENPDYSQYRHLKPDWALACQRMETFVTTLQVRNAVDDIRRQISDNCLKRAVDAQGIYSLTVPTGGGKTYSSLRFALHHAKKHQLDRIFYIIPYTSIIEQNAEAIRNVLHREGDSRPWVLEHHSNLEPEQQTWHSKLVCENWDAPIVLTTMVQFLETLLSGGTRGVRRLHQLANSVIVFDEIQTLPINCIHLFNNSLNFLAANCKTTVVLCTATQPLLHQVQNENKGRLHLPAGNELMPDVADLFEQLKRVEILDKTKTLGWSLEEITALALEQLRLKQSCLIIVNTKNWAQALFKSAQQTRQVDSDALVHLSTAQCPAHRKLLLTKVRQRLDAGLPVLCFSTQLIEAGVDVDFASVIRFQAGLDSLAQAAGRCNRNGRHPTAQVYVVNPDKETIDLLLDIKVGRDTSKRIFNEFKRQDFLKPEVMQQYFQYYFFDRSKEMNYPLKGTATNGANDLLNLLSVNARNPYGNTPLTLHHAFMTAGKAFKAIDAPTQTLVVPYGDGKTLIADLCAVNKKFDAATFNPLLRRSQKYSVNLFPNVWEKLQQQKAIYEIAEGEAIYYLDERFYSEDFGVCTEPCAEQHNLVL